MATLIGLTNLNIFNDINTTCHMADNSIFGDARRKGLSVHVTYFSPLNLEHKAKSDTVQL